jgi:hypothetical protein
MIRFLLFFLLLSHCGPLFSQMDNELAYQSLLRDFIQKNPAPVLTWEGEWPDSWRPTFQQDSLATQKITTGELIISYHRLKKATFRREIELPLSIQDSVFRSEILSFSDTLSLDQIREIRKKSPSAFKGDAPGRLATIVRPIIFVTASVAAVVSLFYIRSR